MDKQENKSPLFGSPEEQERRMYKTADGVIVREVTYDTHRGGDPIEIVQIADIHFNKLNVRDMIEHHPSVISTFNARGLCAYGTSIVKLRPCLDYAADADQLVIAGDTLDYLTHGALAMMDTYIWQRFPDALVALGNHDSMRTMGLEGSVVDPTPREERYALLQRHWKHDVYYTSRVLGDKVTVIQLDNSQYRFWDNQLAPLARDIALAREQGRIVLLFMHSPLCSRNPAEHPLKTFGMQCAHDAVELYEGGVGYRADSVTAAVYDLIIHNADVVRGVFCGHNHSSMASEIMAETPDGAATIIPQYVVGGVYAAPYAIRITVK